MTQKEKAHELINKIANEQYFDDRAIQICISTKKVALVLVDEIIKTLDGMSNKDIRLILFYKVVKKEIEKL